MPKLSADHPSRLTGTVVRVEGPAAVVRASDRDIRVVSRGSLKSGRRRATHPYCTGDLVEISVINQAFGAIERILQRRNLIARVDPGDHTRCHAIAANVDQVIALQSFRQPPLNLWALDRFILMGHAAGVPTIAVINKLDLLADRRPQELDRYPEIGIPLMSISARTGQGLDDLRAILKSRRSVLLGPSGCGKSTMLNALVPALRLRTRPVSKATRRGVHTTVRVEWIDLPDGGEVLDTPGLRVVQPWGVLASNLAGAFPEFRPHLDCRFADCLHRSEPDCGVRRAAQGGAIPAFRYDSYLRILSTLMG